MTTSGRPFTNSTTSARRSRRFSTTVNWLTASQSLFAGFAEVEHSRLRAAHPATGLPVLDRDAVDEQPMEGTVARFQRRAFGPLQGSAGVFLRGGGKIGIEPFDGLLQAAGEERLGVVVAFRRACAGRDVRAVGG